jgi:hypothetical protein
MQALDVRGMAKADIGNNCCNGPGGADLFVQSDRPARETAAEPASQFLASVWTIRNEKDRAVAGHSCCARAGGLQLEKGSNSTMGGTYQYLVKHGGQFPPRVGRTRATWCLSASPTGRLRVRCWTSFLHLAITPPRPGLGWRSSALTICL